MSDIINPTSLYEVDIERHSYIAEAYSILTVPTLVAGTSKLSGMPSSSDLRSFILQSITSGTSTDSKSRPQQVLQSVREMREESRTLERVALQ